MWVRCASKNSLNRIPGYRYTIYDDGDNNNYCVVFTHGTRSRRFVSRSRDPNRVNCICSGRQLFPLPLPPEQYPRSINNGSALFNLFLSLFHSHSPSPFISPTRHGYSNNIVHLRVLGTFGRPTVAKQFQFFFPPDFPSFPPPALCHCFKHIVLARHVSPKDFAPPFRVSAANKSSPPVTVASASGGITSSSALGRFLFIFFHPSGKK